MVTENPRWRRIIVAFRYVSMILERKIQKFLFTAFQLIRAEWIVKIRGDPGDLFQVCF